MIAVQARQLPIGAEVQTGGSETYFRVWAPKRQRVEAVAFSRIVPGPDQSQQPAAQPLHSLELRSPALRSQVPLISEGNGYFSAVLPGFPAGELYAFALDGEALYPDPASRFQPFGPHAASQIIAPATFSWGAAEAVWGGKPLKGQIIYELHLGTFTPEGSWAAAAAKLPHLKDTGITVVEVMPVADFPGTFGWGYDGVCMFAPAHQYGSPDDMRAFVQSAHQLGLGVILDVVYNHLGPSGNYLGQFSDHYLTGKHTDWGVAINFDADDCQPVRDFYLANARYWIREFHLDGLRLDATQSILDTTHPHILEEIVRTVHEAAGGRETIIVAENEDQNAFLLRDYGIDAAWNDDFHHSAIVATTGQRQAYYHDHSGHAQEFISAAKYGYLFQGQQYRWQRKRRGASALGVSPERYVTYIENHDQVANSGRGQRLAQIASPARLRAITALTLLFPGTPMLFQGQEFASSRPFLYFADHETELAHLVRTGRRDFLTQFPALATPEMQRCTPDPDAPETFTQCKLDWSELEFHAPWLAFHRDLLKIRREDPAFSRQEYGKVDGAVLAPHAFVLRYFAVNGQDRLLVVNLGPQIFLFHVPEPLLAPHDASRWKLAWNSEDPKYGGCGMAHPDTETEANWVLHADSAAILVPDPLAPKERHQILWALTTDKFKPGEGPQENE